MCQMEQSGEGPILQGMEEGGFAGTGSLPRPHELVCNVRVSEQPLRCREGCSHLSWPEGDRPGPPAPDSHGRAATSNEGLQG